MDYELVYTALPEQCSCRPEDNRHLAPLDGIGANSEYECHYCSERLLETIIPLGFLLAGVSAAQSMFPVSHDLLRSFRFLGRDPAMDSGVDNLRTVIQTLGVQENGPMVGNGAPFDRLNCVIMLFTGCELSLQSSRISATCVNGICFYLDILREISFDSESLLRIHVVPGRIELKGKICSSVQDIFDQKMDKLKETKSERFKDLTDGAYTFDNPDTVSVPVKPTLTCLELCYKLTNEFNQLVYIAPRLFTELVVDWWVHVKCQHDRSPSVVEDFGEPRYNEWITVQGRRLIFVWGQEVTCLAFLSEYTGAAVGGWIFRRAGCNQCCLRASFQLPSRVPVLIICS